MTFVEEGKDKKVIQLNVEGAIRDAATAWKNVWGNSRNHEEGAAEQIAIAIIATKIMEISEGMK